MAPRTSFPAGASLDHAPPRSPHGEHKVNVGLNLKFNKKNEEVAGYTKRTDKEWLYSIAVQELLAEYLERFVCSALCESLVMSHSSSKRSCHPGSRRCSTMCRRTVMMMSSTKMTFGLRKMETGMGTLFLPSGVLDVTWSMTLISNILILFPVVSLRVCPLRPVAAPQEVCIRLCF